MSTAAVATPAAPVTSPAPASTAGALTAAPAAVVTPAAPAAATTESVNPGSWMAGFSDDLKGFISTKGFKGPEDVSNAYRQLEKMNGVPQDRLVKLPEQFYDDKGVLTAEGRAIKERLGAPKEPKDYGIEAPKEGGDPARLENFLKAAHEMGLSKAEAKRLADADMSYHQQVSASQKEAAAAAFKDQERVLSSEWGAAKEQNTRIAQDAVRALGWDAKKIDAVSNAIGHAETMKLLCNLGKSVGESAFVGGSRTGGLLEPATAKSQIAELTADKDFGARLMNGDASAKAKWQQLHEQAYPGMMVNL